jgi:hypothetical protein
MHGGIILRHLNLVILRKNHIPDHFNFAISLNKSFTIHFLIRMIPVSAPPPKLYVFILGVPQILGPYYFSGNIFS